MHCLLSAGAQIIIDDSTEIVWAARACKECNPGDRVKIMRSLVALGADVNGFMENGVTALLKASFNGNADVVKFLLSSGANIDSADDAGVSPLWVASQEGHMEIVQCLLASGAEVDLRAPGHGPGYSPLMIAAAKGHIDIAAVLLDSGASMIFPLSAADPPGTAALCVVSVARLHGQDEMESWLYEYLDI